jgi:hypothetical protein
VAVLTASASLAHVTPFAIRRTGERLLVGDLRLADARIDAELALQAVDDDFEVQLAHAADDDLAGLLVGVDAERRILRHQLGETLTELLLVALRLRLDRQRDDRSGKSIDSRMMGFFSSHSVSPVLTCFRPTAAAMSPHTPL